MNWRLKILAKLILHHLPVSYDLWQKIGLFRLGFMDQADYAEKIFKLHTERAYPEGIPDSSTFLELGPGDSISSAILAQASGVKQIYLVDTGSYATRDMRVYRQLSRQLRQKNINCIDADRIDNFSALLQACNAKYLTDGLDSLHNLKNNSVDFVWSHSVLEHIRKKEFAFLFNELARIVKPASLMSHNVDFMDHLGGALNNLRFSESIWENDFFANSGFYTNRIRYSEMAKNIQNAGFIIVESGYSSWSSLPTSRKVMAQPFRDWQEKDLLIRCCHFLLNCNS